MAHDLFTVNGTRFAFPALPDDYATEAPDLFERLHGARADVLAKAAKAKHTPLAKPRPYPRVKPGTGEFTPKPGAPGDVLTVDGRDFEVWSMGPGAGSRWVTHAGRYFLLRGTGEYASVEPNPDVVLAPGVTYEWVTGFSGGGVRALVTKADVA